MKRKISIFYFKNRILLFESEDDEIKFIKIKKTNEIEFIKKKK
jgi:hypothetical protein